MYEIPPRLSKNALLHPTVLYKKSVIINCGNYHDVRLYEDYDLFMRVVLEHNMLTPLKSNCGFHVRDSTTSFKKSIINSDIV